MKSEKKTSHARWGYINAASAALFLAVGTSAWGDSIAESDQFLCAAGHVTVCASDGSCENTSASEMDIPRFLIVDLKDQKIRTTEASGANRTSDISIQVRDSAKVIFQGSQGGRALSANISEETGDAAFAIVLDSAVIGVFAICTPIPIN